MLALSLIIAGIILRLLVHAPNFTPVGALALFAGVYLNKKQTLWVPLILMAASDMLLGWHDTAPFTWGGFVLIAILGWWLKRHKTVLGILGCSLVSSFIFYIISNFGVWAMGWYPPTLKGLLECYILALPFLRNFILSTLAYTAIFFGAYELIAFLVKDTRLSKVLLNH